MDPLAARSVVVQNVTQAITSLALELFKAHRAKDPTSFADIKPDMETALAVATIAIEATAQRARATLADAQRIATIFGASGEAQ